MIRQLIRHNLSQSDRYTRVRYARKIRGIRRANGLHRQPTDPRADRAARDYWDRFGIRINPAWHRSYAAVFPSDQAERFIPEDIYYALIEPQLNRYELTPAYEDKNSYDRLLPRSVTLPVLLRMIHGRWYDSDYQPLTDDDAVGMLKTQHGDFILKPSIASGDGINVELLHLADGKAHLGEQPLQLGTLGQRFGNDFLIQPRFTQHPDLAAFHPSSVNTIRFYTLRLNHTIHICAAVLRLGNEGRHYDNRGIPCGITADGRLRDHATTKYFTKHPTHPVTGKAFAGFQIPGWEAACDMVRCLHQHLHYFDCVSWDTTIAPDATPRVLEFNLRSQEINFLQVNNGPLFGDLTDDLLRRVL